MSGYKVMQPMKYSTAKNRESLVTMLESDNYGLQLKRDGSSYVLAKDSDGSVHLYGDKISKRTGDVIDKIENVPHLAAFAQEVFPLESQLVMEVCFGETSKDTNRIMLSTPDRAIARQEEEGLAHGYIFDILFWDGVSVHLEDCDERIVRLEELEGLIDKYPYLSIAETHYRDKARVLEKWLSEGEEGGVLKLLTSTAKTSAIHHLREVGAAPARPVGVAVKVKQSDTADVVITGVAAPSKRYGGRDPANYIYRDSEGEPVSRLYALGLIGALTIGAYNDAGELVDIGSVSSGLTDKMREEIGTNPNDYIGTVIELTCMSKDCVSRTLRHPRFIAFREEKNAQDCTLQHIFG